MKKIIITSDSSEGIAIYAGLKEVQRAEILLANEQDLKADSSQIIRRALTAPRFYQYARQYIFCRRCRISTICFPISTKTCPAAAGTSGNSAD